MKTHATSVRRSTAVIAGAGGLCAALGIAVLLAWHARNAALLQVHPTFAPMVYNTALGFALTGLALLGLAFGRRLPAIVAGTYASAVGLLTLAEYVAGIQLGIDELFMRSYVTVAAPHPGRMAPNTAVCFSLAGSALLAASVPRRGSWRPVVIGAAGAISVAVGVLASTGYMTGVTSTYAWGDLARMAVHTAAGFTVLGLALVAVAWRLQGPSGAGMPYWFPFLVGLGGATLTLCLWQALVVDGRAHIEESIASESARVASELASELEPQLQALGRLAERQGRGEFQSEAQWAGDALRFHRDFRALEAVAWVDPPGRTRWVTPASTPAVLQDLGADADGLAAAVAAARERREVTVAASITLSSGAAGFRVAAPYFSGGELAGSVVGVFRTYALVDRIATASASRGYSLALLDGGRLVYGAGGGTLPDESEWGKDTALPERGASWAVRVWPNAAKLYELRSAMPEVALAVGLLLSLVFSVTACLAEAARLRAREAVAANGALQIEIEQRVQAERALREAHDLLEQRVAERTAELAEANSGLRAEVAQREQAEEALRRSGSDLAGIKFALDQASIVAITDTRGDITFVNDKFCEISKYSREELVGQNHRILGSGHHPRAFFVGLWRTIARGEVWRGEIKNRAKDGSFYWVDTTIVPLPGVDGKPHSYVAIRTDITDRKRAERALRESEERFRLLVDGVKDYAIYMLDPDGRVASWNMGAQELKGYGAGEIIGRHFSCFYPAEDVASGVPDWELATAAAEGRAQVEGWRIRKDGSRFRAHVLVTAIRDAAGRLRGFAKITRDITAQKLAEEALLRAHDELELRVQERTAELTRANADLEEQIRERLRAEEQLQVFTRKLQRSNRELQDFASVASHDLQEPLRKVQAFGDRLKAKCGEALGADARDYLERMLGATSRMQTLINDLLTFSRVETRGQPFASVDLGALAQEVLSDLEVRIEQTGGRVDVGELPRIDADATQVRQLLQNLIGNALKFHKPGQAPVVRVRGRRVEEDGGPGEDEARCEIVVEDEGIGFDEKYLDRIFTIFQRLHGRGEYEGTGIGLAVCRRIVERHGGQITARSAPGLGATFIITLPVSQPIGATV